jgi:tRNA pseudouridine(38-40) synthase
LLLIDDDEIDYVGVLNRALPDDIRVLGWCPVPHGFSARFSCLHREYKYIFINDGLDIDVMHKLFFYPLDQSSRQDFSGYLP